MVLNNSINAPTPFSVDNGGLGVSSLTTYAPICGGTTTTGPAQSIASVGTLGQKLTSNGPGALPTMQDSVSGTGRTLVSVTDISSPISEAAFTGLTSLGSFYEFIFSFVAFSVNGADLLAQVSSDGGVSFESTNYDFAGVGRNSNASAVESRGDNASALNCTGDSGVGSDSDEALQGSIILDNPYAPKPKTVFYIQLAYLDTSTQVTSMKFSGYHIQASTSQNAVRFYPSSGNFTGGSISLYETKAAT